MNIQNADNVIDIFDRGADLLRSLSVRRGCAVRLPAKGRLLVTGDLHDNPFHFDAIVKLAHLEQSADHHVILHELIHGDRLINGLDLSYRMLVKVAQLALEYPGQVHPLLANHEISQMTGRAVSKGAGNSVEFFNDGLRYIFGDEAKLVSDACGRFIAAMPLALLSERGVCCAHSLPNAGMMKWFDPAVLERELVRDDYDPPSGPAYTMTWGRKYTDEQLDHLAATWNVELFCLGHQHVEMGIEARGPRVIVLNSDHERAAVVAIDLANIPDPDEAAMAAIALRTIV